MGAVRGASAGMTGGERHQELSYFLVVTAVRVRGLPDTIADAPLVTELTVDSCSLLTEPLLPLPVEKEDAMQFERPSSADSAHFLSAGRTLGLDSLHIVIPIAGDWRWGALREKVSSSPFLHGGEAASMSRGGIHVVLRTADEALPWGSASCYYPGDWFPMTPCGGEVQVGFEVYCQESGDVSGLLVPGQMSLDGQSELAESHSWSLAENQDVAFVPTDGDTGGCTHLSRVASKPRQVRSACSSPTSRLACWKRRVQTAGQASGERGRADGPSLCSDSVHLNHSAYTDADFLHPRLSYVFLVESASGNQLESAGGENLNPNEFRTRACQPRSLVFSHIKVSGFQPITSHGSWTLEFSWPQHKVSPMKRIMWIPGSVDGNGAAEIQETLSIDLPLFMRGEIQTHMHAVWSGSSNNDPKTRLYVQVEFDPIVLVVGDHEMHWEGCRSHGPMLTNGLPLTVSDLCVRFLVKLEFYEPQRDGRNGRPTSAVPRHREKIAAAAADATGESEMGRNKGVLRREAPESVEKSATQRAAEGREGPPCVNGVHHAETWTRGVHSLPRHGGSDVSHRTGACTEPLAPLQNRKQQQKQQEQQSQRRGRGTPSSQRSKIATQMFPDVRGLVPCYSEQRRQEVFRAYDTKNCGHMTIEQMLHFCRAHVALFDGEENDASILRGLRPYVASAAVRSHAETCSSSNSPPSSCRRSRSLSLERRGGPRTSANGHELSVSHPLPLSSAPSEGASAAASLAPMGFAGCESQGITYNMFEIIALRLASM
ncbi:hypothetical protein TCSYLVIO_005931 [Trypanosoma cruzi]|nr:hypothetical protein TCSYLVIO_005931 [Trypanosoma cruzi]